MRVVVLNDGETYTDISGCRVVDVPDDVDVEDVESWLKDNPEAGSEVNEIIEYARTMYQFLLSAREQLREVKRSLGGK